jgi:hypothetical protein
MLIRQREPGVTWLKDLGESIEAWLEKKLEMHKDYIKEVGDKVRVEVSKREVAMKVVEGDSNKVIKTIAMEAKTAEEDKDGLVELVEKYKEEFKREIGRAITVKEMWDKPKELKNFLTNNNKFLSETTSIAVSGIDEAAWYIDNGKLYNEAAAAKTKNGETMFLGVQKMGKTIKKGTWMFIDKKEIFDEANFFIKRELPILYTELPSYEELKKYRRFKAPTRVSLPWLRENNGTINKSKDGTVDDHLLLPRDRKK